MSELPFKQSPDVERAQERREMVPGVDVGKLSELVSEGVIPATVLGLYEELATDDMERPLLRDFADAEPEKQQMILRALEKTARKVEALSDEKVTKEFQLSLMTLLAFVYAMFLRKSMSTRITTDATLDPGKNEEGALLRVLELNGKEVFVHPEKFEIKDFKQFLKNVIYKGHGREVLDSLGEIDAAHHADIIFDCLQVSRQKTGTLESVYVIDALAKCKQLTTVVAEQLCRLGFDHIVVERLAAFREEDLQDVVMLLFKRKKLGLREIMTATLDLPPGNHLKHVLISVCYLDKKLFASLLSPE
ncbi:hypothetical protein KBA73_04725, partial [Patescibacteria group bacterium]|nr:hypothetical protein [Patescibacteria group bacterium]